MEKIESFVAYLFENVKALDSNYPGYRIDAQDVYQCLHDSCGEWLEKNTDYFERQNNAISR